MDILDTENECHPCVRSHAREQLSPCIQAALQRYTNSNNQVNGRGFVGPLHGEPRHEATTFIDREQGIGPSLQASNFSDVCAGSRLASVQEAKAQCGAGQVSSSGKVISMSSKAEHNSGSRLCTQTDHSAGSGLR